MSQRSATEITRRLAALRLTSKAGSRALAAPLGATSTVSAIPSSAPSTSSLPRQHFSTTSQRCLATEAPPQSEAAAEAAEASTSNSAETVAAPAWTPDSRRVGLLARKHGMLSYFLSTGQAVPCTVLQIDANQVSAQIGFDPAAPHPTHDEQGRPLRVPQKAPYMALQVAATDVTSRRGIAKAQRGHLKKAGINRSKRVMKEFKITADALLPLGTELSASHFVPGQSVDVSSTSRGKGFQGPMKRHGFSGLRASHGVSISHRSHGSTGQHQDPGRVFPGKKMAGRMGGKRATVHNLRVLRVDLDRQLVLVQGNVPGPEGVLVEVTDARRSLIWKALKKQRKHDLTGSDALPDGVVDLPFPAGTKAMEAELPRVIEWTGGVEASEAKDAGAA